MRKIRTKRLEDARGYVTTCGRFNIIRDGDAWYVEDVTRGTRSFHRSSVSSAKDWIREILDNEDDEKNEQDTATPLSTFETETENEGRTRLVIMTNKWGRGISVRFEADTPAILERVCGVFEVALDESGLLKN